MEQLCGSSAAAGTYTRNWRAGEASETLFRCTECKFAIYMCGGMYVYIVRMYVTTFSSVGTPLRKGGRVRPQSFLLHQRHTERGGGGGGGGS